MPWLMERQLDRTAGRPAAAARSKRAASRSGSTRRPRRSSATTPAACARCGSKTARSCAADLVVMAVGIRPNTALAEAAGLALQPRHRRQRHAADLRPAHLRRRRVREPPRHRLRPGRAAVRDGQGVRQPSRAGTASAATPARSSRPSSRSPASTCSRPATSSAATAPRRSCCPTPAPASTRSWCSSDDRLVGGVLYGDTADGAWYFQLLRDGAERRRHPRPADVRRGQPRRRRPPGRSRTSRAMADDMEVCGCNGVCKGAIVKAIKDKGLFTLDDVRKHTKASSSCGSCTGLVEQILINVLGADYSAAPKTEAAVRLHRPHAPGRARRRSATQRLLTIPDGAASSSSGARPNGCATCRPGAELLPDLHLAARGAGRSAVALHQRAQPRQHPEGRHLLGGAAHVGRRDQRRRSCAASPTWSTSTASRRSR